MNILTLQFLLGIIIGTIILLHIAKKNLVAILAYSIQSLLITIILFDSFLKTGNVLLFFVILIIFIVKVVLAPIFFIKLIKKYALVFSVDAYLGTPITLIVITIIIFITNSQKFLPLSNILPDNKILLSLTLSSIFLSLFLIINRKEALSQIIGILSLENSIVAFSIFAGLEQSPALQLGIIFNIFIWIIIAVVFMSMIYKHFGSLNVSYIKNLKD